MIHKVSNFNDISLGSFKANMSEIKRKVIKAFGIIPVDNYGSIVTS